VNINSRPLGQDPGAQLTIKSACRKLVAVLTFSAPMTRSSQIPAPTRIVLGSDAWGIIQKALAERLVAVERQKHLAVSTDFAATA
jgi:hypothetical protein